MSSRLERLAGLTRSAGARLTLWYSAFLVGGCVFFLAFAYFLLSTSLARSDHEAVLSKFWDLAGVYQDSGADGLVRAVRYRERQTQSRPFFIRFAPEGGSFADAGVDSPWEEFDLRDLERLPKDKVERWVVLPSRGGEESLEILSSKLAGGLLLQVGMSSRHRSDTLARFAAIALWALAGGILISLPGGFILSRRALAPVRDLIATIKRIEAGAVGARVPARRSGDEFDELGRLFNGMLARVETLIEGMKAALDAVAHDLRTPMTRLRSGAEQALSDEADLPACREALADCVEESDRVVGMITTLMDISEAETGIMRLDAVDLDLRALIEEAVELYRDAAAEKEVGLEAVPGGPVPVRADRNRMRQVLSNLLDNAVKYTPRGGRVRLEASLRGAEAVLSVGDTGPGIPAQDMPRIWDRLYRGDSSRSQRGLGLGLSLVKAVVAAHGGGVEARSVPGEGSRFEVRMPAKVA